MTRRHRLNMVPHPFIADTEVRDWHGEHPWCSRCGFTREHRIHTEYKPVNGDRSDAILGEKREGHDAA